MTKKYQTRKSPPYHAVDCKGKTMKGKNGMYISKPDRRNVYKWVKVSVPKKVYEIHDNGSRPFFVYDFGKSVEVYSTEWIKETHAVVPKEVVFSSKYKKLFVGKDDDYPGNSLLLQINDHKYIHIGSDIYSFETEDSIQSYFSPVGNSDVPYPYAVGSKYTYLMIELVRIENEALAYPFPELDDDPYSKYYLETRIRDSKYAPKHTTSALYKDIRKRADYYNQAVARIQNATVKMKIQRIL